MERRGIREPGNDGKEAVSEYAQRTSGCSYDPEPGGEPLQRLTVTLRDPRAPGLSEVRGFCLPSARGRPVRTGPRAAGEAKGQSDESLPQDSHSRPRRTFCLPRTRRSGARAVRVARQRPTQTT